MKANTVNRRSFHSLPPSPSLPLGREAVQWRTLPPSLWRRPMLAREERAEKLRRDDHKPTPYERQAKRSNPRSSWPRGQRL